MHKWILRLVIVALACACAVVISCNSSSDGDGGSMSGWSDANNDGIYDPYQSYDLWYDMMNAVTAKRAQGFSLVAVAHAATRVRWRDTNKNGICDWVEDPALWAKVCSAPWIDDNGDGICDNYYMRPGGGWVYLGDGAGSWQYTPPADTTPNPFDFVDVTDAELSDVVTSNVITIRGINLPAAITMDQNGTDAQYRINGGAWTSAAGEVNNGDTVQLKMTSANDYITTLTCTITIGGVSDDWSVKTRACFAAETKVVMAGGSTKPITEVKKGEKVMAFDPKTGKSEPRLVSMTYQSRTTEFLVINGSLRATAGHPFLTAAGKWVKAGELKKGDKLRGLDGVIVVRSIKKQKVNEACYNLEVEGLHTFIVSTDGKEKFVVHNKS